MKHKPFFAAAVPNPDVALTFFACFGGHAFSTSWVVERGQRRVFTSKDEAELAAYRLLIAHLNDNPAAVTMAKRITLKGGIRAFREEGVGKGGRPVVDHTSEASVVFANFKGKSL